MPERIYGLLLRLYPQAFRDQYASAMLQVFRDRAAREDGPLLWLDVLLDLAVSLPREHLRARPRSFTPGAWYPLSPHNVLKTPVDQAGYRSAFLWFAPAVILLTLNGGNQFLGFLYIACAAITLWNALRWQRARRQYALEIEDDTIRVKYDGVTPRTLRRDEITGMVYHPGAGLRLATADPTRYLWIPQVTASFRAARAQLGTWFPEVKGPPLPANPLAIGDYPQLIALSLLVQALRAGPALWALSGVVFAMSIAALLSPRTPRASKWWTLGLLPLLMLKLVLAYP